MDISDKLTNLKNQLLDLAIRGKLVEQRPEEGTAEELYVQIQEEKKKLIADGKIKKEKPLPEITDEEIPFELPENWKWARWGNISQKIQYGLNASALAKGTVKFVRISDIHDNYVDWDNVPYCDASTEEISSYELKKNDILFARTGGTVGKSYLVGDIPEQAVFAGYLIRTQYGNMLEPYFLKFFMESSLYWAQLRNGVIATAQPNCNGQTLSKMLVPLPPLAEQKRIVAKLESYLAVIDKAEELIERKANLDEEIRNKILDLAIRGKLVEQRPEEGSAEELYTQIQEEKQKLIAEGKIKKEKPLPEITEDEIPFEIPESWKWVRLGNCVSKTIKRGKSPKYTDKSGTLVFAQKCNSKYEGTRLDLALYLDESVLSKYDSTEYMVDKDIVINSTGGGTMGRVGIYKNSDNPNKLPVVPDSHVTVIRSNKLIDSIYLFYFIKNKQPYLESLGDGSTNQTELKPDTLKELIVPLPPLAEQKRIVDKIEELLPYCDKLK